jgi:hypothetical protein
LLDDSTDLTPWLTLLETGEIGQELGRVRLSSNYTFLLSVCNDTHSAPAVYKPQRGERPLWDFPDGTLCYRERAAFLVSESLGWRIVPPTVLRSAGRGLGSLQFYIEHNPQVTYFDLDKRFAGQLFKIALFDYVTNNADRKGGHCLLAANGKLWGIDHGICFNVAPKLRTVIWDFIGESIPNTMLADLTRTRQALADTNAPLRTEVETLLAPPEIVATLARFDRLLKLGKFPEPPHGPSYPWPPV